MSGLTGAQYRDHVAAEPDYLDYLDLDQDDLERASRQLADRFRAAILQRRLAPGDPLPSRSELAAWYGGIAPRARRRALELLQAEGLAVVQRDSRAFVDPRAPRVVEMEPYIVAAFERSSVTVDFAGVEGATLRGALATVLDKVRDKRLEPPPETVRVRALIGDPAAPAAFPVRAGTRSGDPVVRQATARTVRRVAGDIIDLTRELDDLVESATAELRFHSATPLLELCVMNGETAVFGFHPIVERVVAVDGEPVAVYDLMRTDVPLFHYATSENELAQGTRFVEAAQQWFDALWATTLSREYGR